MAIDFPPRHAPNPRRPRQPVGRIDRPLGRPATADPPGASASGGADPSPATSHALSSPRLTPWRSPPSRCPLPPPSSAARSRRPAQQWSRRLQLPDAPLLREALPQSPHETVVAPETLPVVAAALQAPEEVAHEKMGGGAAGTLLGPVVSEGSLISSAWLGVRLTGSAHHEERLNGVVPTQ